MNDGTRHYDYRQSSFLFACAFLWVWSIGFFLGGLSTLRERKIEVNGQMVTGDAAIPYSFIFLLVPIPVSLIGVGIFLKWKNESIDLDRYEIRWIDMLGRERGKASVSEVTGLGTGVLPSQKRILLRSGEPIPYSQSIRLPDDLERRIQQIAKGGDMSLPTDQPRFITGFVASEQVYRYRSTTQLLAGVIPILMVLVFLILTEGAQFAQPMGGATLAGLGILSLFLLIGSFFFLSFANEKVVLTPNELVKIDRFGRERMRVPLGDVTSVSERSNSDGPSTTTIVTRSGDLTINSNLSGYRELRDELERLVVG